MRFSKTSVHYSAHYILQITPFLKEQYVFRPPDRRCGMAWLPLKERAWGCTEPSWSRILKPRAFCLWEAGWTECWQQQNQPPYLIPAVISTLTWDQCVLSSSSSSCLSLKRCCFLQIHQLWVFQPCLDELIKVNSICLMTLVMNILSQTTKIHFFMKDSHS